MGGVWSSAEWRSNKIEHALKINVRYIIKCSKERMRRFPPLAAQCNRISGAASAQVLLNWCSLKAYKMHEHETKLLNMHPRRIRTIPVFRVPKTAPVDAGQRFITPAIPAYGSEINLGWVHDINHWADKDVSV